MTQPVLAAAPTPSFRLIPSRFPPIGLFDSITRAADLPAVLDLVGWTNDRLVAPRLRRLPPEDWVVGRPNASVVMAALLHVAPQGARFNGPDLGAWYAAAALPTAVAEVAHHMRREAVAMGVAGLNRQFRCYSARLTGAYRDICGNLAPPGVMDPASYAASQAFGEGLRQSGGDGVIYDSVRHRGGICIAAYRPRQVLEVTQRDHYRIAVTAAGRQIRVTPLKA